MLFYDQVAKQGHVDSIKTCKLIDCLFTCDDRGRSYIYIYMHGPKIKCRRPLHFEIHTGRHADTAGRGYLIW
jgi:hypothetical protein